MGRLQYIYIVYAYMKEYNHTFEFRNVQMEQVHRTIFQDKSTQSLMITRTGDPHISWFHNSWSPLFDDSFSGLNFVNSLPFHDLEKKIQKKKYFSEFWNIFLSFFV